MQSVDLIIMFVRSGKKRENKAQLRLSSLVNAIFGHRSESINISLLIINYEETFFKKTAKHFSAYKNNNPIFIELHWTGVKFFSCLFFP